MLEDLTVKIQNKLDNHLYQNLKKQLLYANIYLIFICITGFISLLIHLRPRKADYDIFLAFILFRDHFPLYGHILRVIYRGTFLIILFITIAPLNALIYASIFIQINIASTLKQFEQILTCRGNTEEDILVYDENYQAAVYHGLRLLIDTRIYLTGIIEKINKDLLIYMHIIVVFGGLAGISILFFLLSYSENWAFYEYFRLTSLAIPTMAVAGATIYQAQQGLDTAFHVRDILLSQTDWYNWNRRNKKIFIILIMSLQKPVALRFFQDIFVSYNLGLRLLKSIYSVVTVLLHMKKNYINRHI